MQSEHHNATSRNLRISTENYIDLRATHHASPDTRRFATIFPMEAPRAISNYDTTHEEQNDSDDLSRSKFIAALDENASTTQVASVPSVGESSTLSAAQHVVACYRAIHDSDYAPECDMTEKELPQIPDDQRSMYTLATSTDTQSTMDMMWRPKPKVHMRHTDQLALMQAQGQAIAMMHNAGLRPTNKIQCRRRGCADILSNVEALKYHIHIHNIADFASQCSGSPPPAACNTSLVECSISRPEGLKRSHSRSKSSHGTRHKFPKTCSFPRKLSVGTLPPSLFSPRETAPETSSIPSFTAVAKAFTPDSSPNKSSVPLPMHNNEAPSRGRRERHESTTVSVGDECNPSIAMLLSPPSSPIMHGRLVQAPHSKSSVPCAFGVKDAKGDNSVTYSNESAHLVPDQIMRSRSPARALSPTRAMSPIRNGIKRILTMGNATDQ